MKIFGILRGFPGLGRVMSGISLLTSLKDMGHEVKAYSYLQGINIIQDAGMQVIPVSQPSTQEVMAIGLNPIGNTTADLIKIICDEKPDLVIIDGEPLLISTLAMVYPREKLMALLNPSDLYNPSLPESSIQFYHYHYLSAGTAIVHGINAEAIVLPQDKKGCKILQTNTILRKKVLEAEVGKGNKIVSILGGGCNNASNNFFESTVNIGKSILEAALLMPKEGFSIYCNDKNIASELIKNRKTQNVEIVSEYVSPECIYSSAKIILCRAGRNTISEILYLNIPAILMSSSGDFRSVEQEKNIDQACEMNPNRIMKICKDENSNILVEKIVTVLHSEKSQTEFVPGNNAAISFVLNAIGLTN